MSRYIADLLSFGLWSMHEPAQYDDRIAPDTEELVNGSDFVGAAHRLCYVDLTGVHERTHVPAQLDSHCGGRRR